MQVMCSKVNYKRGIVRVDKDMKYDRNNNVKETYLNDATMGLFLVTLYLTSKFHTLRPEIFHFKHSKWISETRVYIALKGLCHMRHR